ncbi:hypothetical protein DFH07DRAFT_774412 [Mycena maculata]|uniref:DUF6535 domain-containing protein n=1 Tax=Mycena maculata TaxID=230809 RepID=A0AAD7IZ90_9AGAR|nr:hypothetical protein DFH07DRAFT_774412 [Mycena maculata]
MLKYSVENHAGRVVHEMGEVEDFARACLKSDQNNLMSGHKMSTVAPFNDFIGYMAGAWLVFSSVFGNFPHFHFLVCIRRIMMPLSPRFWARPKQPRSANGRGLTCLLPTVLCGREPRHSGSHSESEGLPRNVTLVTGQVSTLADSKLQSSRLIDILDQQLSILRRIDQRQAAADLTQQPIPEVPATNSSAWNALLGSTLTDTIEPRVERWRMISQSGKSVSGLNTTNVPFQPDPSTVRVNAFWSVSVTSSLSIAALAVMCRGFLNMITWSRHKKASERLEDIWTRWAAADRVLRPAIEALPHLLIFPVFLFIIGILDLLFSSVRELPSPPPFLLFAFGLSVLCITAVAALLCFTIIDGSINPGSSPFQSRLARTIHTSLIPTLKICTSLMRRMVLPHRTPAAAEEPHTAPIASADVDTTRLPVGTIDLYHKVVQLTHEDASLDQAAGALFNIIHERAGTPRYGKVRISSQECTTLRHLLSPEASIRSNRTAAWVIVRMQTVDPHRSVMYSNGDFGLLLASLTEAGRRSRGGFSLTSLWGSPFVRAISVMLLEEDIDPTDHPIILHCLSSRHSSWRDTLFGPPMLTRNHQAVLSFLLDILYAKLHEELPAVVNQSEARIVDLLLSPKFTLAAVPVSIDSGRFMQSLVHHSPGDDRRELSHIIRWIIKVTSPEHVIARYLRDLEAMSAAQVRYLSWIQCGNIFAIVDTVGRICLDLEDFEGWEDLADLCTTCLVNFITFRNRLAIAAFPFDLILTFSTVVRNTRLNPASLAFQHLPTIYQYVHDTPHSRYSEVLSEIQGLLDMVEEKEDKFEKTSRLSLWDGGSSRLSWKINNDPESDLSLLGYGTAPEYTYPRGGGGGFNPVPRSISDHISQERWKRDRFTSCHFPSHFRGCSIQNV